MGLPLEEFHFTVETFGDAVAASKAPHIPDLRSRDCARPTNWVSPQRRRQSKKHSNQASGAALELADIFERMIQQLTWLGHTVPESASSLTPPRFVQPRHWITFSRHLTGPIHQGSCPGENELSRPKSDRPPGPSAWALPHREVPTRAGSNGTAKSTPS
jgi:hypothetical protein